jgi:uncharacterized membrane protein YjfL (UPF0719 family)
MKLSQMTDAIIATGTFAGIGLAVFGIAFFLIVKLSPFSVRKEIEEDQNISLGIIMAGVFIGISLIIAAAIGGG